MIGYLIAICIFAGLIFMAILLAGEKKKSKPLILSSKPVLSLGFILTALALIVTWNYFSSLIIFGFIFAMAGDICLIFHENKRIFMVGLISFLAGHLFYCLAFFISAANLVPLIIAAPILAVLGFFIFKRLSPVLGKMKIPVLAYIIVISLMVLGAAALFGNTEINITCRILIIFGAILFYISDLFIARHRFVKEDYINRAFGLPLYYSAQYLIAFSLYYFE